MLQSRKKFLALISLLSFGSIAKANATAKKAKLAHHVFFWLKDPSSTADRDKLIQGVKALGKIKEVKMLHVAVPASTEKRDVVDNSYSVSELLFFDSAEDEKIYQDHPLHQKFIQEHSMLWNKVVVYDCMEV
jgi:hypothetical protein